GIAGRTSQPLSHLDARGAARMVDVAAKASTVREALAECVVRMAPATLRAVKAGTAKGDAIQVARVAGITAAAVAGLTLIDMTKGVEKGVYLETVRLLEKSGGRSGIWKRTRSTKRN